VDGVAELVSPRDEVQLCGEFSAVPFAVRGRQGARRQLDDLEGGSARFLFGHGLSVVGLSRSRWADGR
jgi:hypothetical protein